MIYLDELKKVMTWLGKQEETFFLGQTVKYPGSPMNQTFEGVPKEKKLELPLIEDDQMGMSIGLSLEGFIPISVYPRIDFLIIAMNQLVNHLDKIDKMSNGEFKPGVIIRTQVGNTKPLWPGLQHCGNYTVGLRAMLKNVNVVTVRKAEVVKGMYKRAYEDAKKGKSTILIELPQGANKEQWEKSQCAE